MQSIYTHYSGKEKTIMLLIKSGYLVHDACIVFGQDQWHVFSCASELEVAWVLTVLLFTKDFSSLFHLLNINRTNGDPSETF